jgi:hypothetical protein
MVSTGSGFFLFSSSTIWYILLFSWIWLRILRKHRKLQDYFGFVQYLKYKYSARGLWTGIQYEYMWIRTQYRIPDP